VEYYQKAKINFLRDFLLISPGKMAKFARKKNMEKRISFSP